MDKDIELPSSGLELLKLTLPRIRTTEYWTQDLADLGAAIDGGADMLSLLRDHPAAVRTTCHMRAHVWPVEFYERHTDLMLEIKQLARDLSATRAAS